MKSLIKNNILIHADLEDIQIIDGESVYKIPENVKSVNFYAFNSFRTVKNNSLNNNFFNTNFVVDKVVFNNNITEIPGELFLKTNIREVVLTNSITTIGMRAFTDSKIEKITLPESVKTIGAYAFSECINLINIKLPSSLNEIGYYCFAYSNIFNIEIPNSVFKIGDYAFRACNNLREIKLPKHYSYTRLKSGLFEDCKNLKKVIIPDNVTYIESDCFMNCKNLEIIESSKNIKSYNVRCFCGCTHLKELTLTNVKRSPAIIDEYVFSNCTSLEKLNFNGEFQLYSNALESCNSLKYLHIYNEDYDFSALNNIKLYLDNDGNLEKLSEISKLIKNYTTIEYDFACTLCCFQQTENFKNAYFKFYNRLKSKFIKENTNPNNIASLEKFGYNLGLFDTNREIANKAYTFLEEMFTKNILDINDMYTIFKDMNANGYKKDFVDFITKKENFAKIIKLENQELRMLAPIYNYFEILQQNNLSHNNHHRMLAPNVERFKEMLTAKKFKYVTPDNLNIAEEIGKFTSDQYYFDLAVKVNKELEEMEQNTGYKDENMLEDPFETIESLETEILKTNKKSLVLLKNIIDNDFTFEWLSKHDPRNYMLGYYCSCCCHLGGAGDGIVRASIILPNVKNLVVKDNKERIVAKATLYINEKYGYGVFNTIQVSEQITTERENEKIFQKFLKGAYAFVSNYNKKHKLNPLIQINVGVGLNSLTHLLNRDFVETDVLNAIDFAEYKIDHNYDGDWQLKQYCIFNVNEQYKNKDIFIDWGKTNE